MGKDYLQFHLLELGYFVELVEQGTVKIQDMYNDKHMREQLDRVAVLEVQELIEGLNLNNCTVIVKIK